MIPGPLGMGGAPLGNLFARIPEDVAAATMQAAWDAGIRHFDTAPHYGAGLSEHRMGAALRLHPRDAYTLSSKVGRILEPAQDVPELDQGFVGALPFRRRVDYSAAGTIRSIEDSLQRLGLARLDIVYIHDVSEDWHGPAWKDRFAEAMAGAAKALTDLRRQGVIRAWGLGVNLVAPCLAALEQAEPDVFLVAGRYTLLDHGALDQLFPACAARGAKVVLGGPYNSGLLAGGTTFNYETAPPEMVARARAIAAVCARHGVDLKAAALQFCAAHPVVATVIPGARTPAEMRENAAMMQAPIPDALWAELKREGLLPGHAPTP
ncbi:aldo/keto reductase [Limobrevibacterium gyesilva]|uniref:Aldo/keto reductase n=1 Tax=Limobrevibacterium gyesilva TaxID=2991712 RepID=A0AA41YPU0_9PROT|nr:aldo/keto reductase [Limobrevibacterium gyesilva]MCW3474280.1 aldo/keto reductase [Limobrevibacterium gyesilva]